MFKSLRTLAFATLLPFALPTLAQVNATLPANVQKALQTNKLTGNDLSLVLIPLDGPGNPTYYNADVSVNPASTMKLFTTYAALEMLGPTYQWKTEFYTDGQLKNGVLNGNLYLKGGGDPKLNMEKLWLLMRDLRPRSQVTWYSTAATSTSRSCRYSTTTAATTPSRSWSVRTRCWST